MTNPLTTNTPPWPPRPLREDEELLRGRVTHANSSRIRITGHPSWINYGALGPDQRPEIEIGDELEVVVSRARWINFVRLAGPGAGETPEPQEVPF